MPCFLAGVAAAEAASAVAGVPLYRFSHQCGHLAAAKLMHIGLSGMRLGFLGARLDVEGRMLSFGEEWLLCAAGPAVSLLAVIAAAPFWSRSSAALIFSCASFVLGLLNLLPIKGFDGGRMMACTLYARMEARRAELILHGMSFVFLFLLWSVAVYFLLRAGDGLSLFCFSLSLFLRFFEDEKS